jgi:putative transposase
MRTARIKLKEENAVYHVIGRVVGGEFLLGEVEKERFRIMSREHARFAGVEIITHCVMNNHFHILVRVPESKEVSDPQLVRRAQGHYKKNSPYLKLLEQTFEQFGGKLSRDLREGLLSRMGDISFFMKELKQRYTKWFNKQHGRFGTLWAERFKSVLVEDAPSVVAKVAAYIDLNPVRAGLVADPKDYRWCGYAEAVAGSKEARAGIESFSEGKGWRNAATSYRLNLFVKAGVSGRSDKVALDREAIRKVLEQGGELAMAEALQVRVRYFTDGVVLGSKEFVDSVFSEFRDRFGERRTSGARKLKGGRTFSDLATVRNLRRQPFG